MVPPAGAGGVMVRMSILAGKAYDDNARKKGVNLVS